MPGGFSPNLFVGRNTDLEKLIAWATAPIVPKRLQTIAAPPGYGKSWLLHQLQHRLSDRPDLFLIDLPVVELKSKADITAWLLSVIARAQQVCSTVRSSEQSDSLGAIIYNLVEDLCRRCEPSPRPILLVDDFDELLPTERDMMEKQLLEQFWSHPCLKVLLCFRDEFSLSSPTLRRGEERKLLTVFTPDVGREQLQKRAEVEKNPTLLPENILASVPPYDGTHPGINTCLYEKIKEKTRNGPSPVLTADDLRACWLLPIQKKINQVSITLDLVEKDLRSITTGADTWTLETFAERCGYSRSSAYHHIQNLIALSLVSLEKQRYKVVDGIREIIRAEAALLR